jgi:hypothetical protein
MSLECLLIGLAEVIVIALAITGLIAIFIASVNSQTSSTGDPLQEGSLSQHSNSQPIPPVTDQAADKTFVSTVSYRTSDGSQDYRFQFRQMPDEGFRIYILSQPEYGGHSTDSHPTHRFRDTVGFYICWSEKITSYDNAKEIAKRFAEATEKYRKFGTRF